MMENTPNPVLVELRKLVIAQKTTLLPSEPARHEFQTLHSALEEYDRVLSEAVIAAIQQRQVSIPPALIATMRNAAQKAIEDPDLPEGREKALYQKYKNRLDQISDLLIALL